jgi:tetratricopeptide (TPR) repeat protein
MPLGVELAASWIPVLSCQEIAAGIAHNLDFLTTTLRDIPGRHRSLRAVFQHSWSLLTADEQAVLRQLSVFRGGFTRDAAEQVTGTVLLPLAGLVRKSLVTRESNGRYTIHELLRQFANERLAESGEEEQAQQHHLNYFVQYAEKVEPELFGPEQAVWLKQLQRDHNNFQAAIECTLKSAHTETGLRLASALGTFWMVRGHVSEGRRILSKLLALSETGLPNLLVAKAHIEAATLANAQGDQIGAEMWFQKSFEGYRQLDDKRGMARAFNGLGNVAWMKGDFKRAHNYYSESLSLYRELDDEDGIAGALNMLGLVALEQGELVQAFTQLDQSLALHRKQGNLRGMATILNNLGNVSEDPVQAATYYQESLILCGALGDMVNSAETLEGLAGVAQRCDQTVPAARLLGAVVAFRSLLDVAQPIQDQIDHQNLIAAIRSQLSETRFEAAWAEGQTMTLEQAVDYGLQVSGVLSASGQPKN